MSYRESDARAYILGHFQDPATICVIENELADESSTINRESRRFAQLCRMMVHDGFTLLETKQDKEANNTVEYRPELEHDA